jgi:hypothetical protein
VREVAPIAGDVILDKITMSAFESTFPNLALRDAQLESFIIAGIAMEVGIEPVGQTRRRFAGKVLVARTGLFSFLSRRQAAERKSGPGRDFQSNAQGATSAKERRRECGASNASFADEGLNAPF